MGIFHLSMKGGEEGVKEGVKEGYRQKQPNSLSLVLNPKETKGSSQIGRMNRCYRPIQAADLFSFPACSTAASLARMET